MQQVLNLDFEPSLGEHKGLNDQDIRLLAECSQAVSLKRIADAMELLAGKEDKNGLPVREGQVNWIGRMLEGMGARE